MDGNQPSCPPLPPPPERPTALRTECWPRYATRSPTRLYPPRATPSSPPPSFPGKASKSERSSAVAPTSTSPDSAAEDAEMALSTAVFSSSRGVALCAQSRTRVKCSCEANAVASAKDRPVGFRTRGLHGGGQGVLVGRQRCPAGPRGCR